jgi:heparan-alpha-glucosaminide N-acetyltransferase
MIPDKLPRISSIDILRALTMVLMIFVNDLWSLNNIPQWLEHAKGSDDAMGLADIVFPAFLVIVGMSVPFSIASRRNKGESQLSILLHIALRSFALIVMGLFLVNGEHLNETNTGMPDPLWTSLACLSFILIWNAYPPSINKKLIVILKITGCIILLILAYIFRGGRDGSQHFGISWWGILGLIGWAYLISALVYTFLGSNILSIILFWLLCIVYCASSHAQIISPNSFLRTLAQPFQNGSMPAFVTAGIITSMIFIEFQKRNKPYQLIMYLILISIFITIAGLSLRHFWGISKIRATPSWVLICTGITIATFAFIYWLADIKRKSQWFNIIKPAGTNTLLCYLLPYFAYALIYGLFNASYPDQVSTGAIGLFKSFLFAIVIVQITGPLTKAGLRLKL